MNRRAVTLVLIALGTIGSLSVLAQQTYQQPPATQGTPDSTHLHSSGYPHHGNAPTGSERDALTSRHLAVARAQLQEARREIDPNARIDRMITAFDELIAGLEYLEQDHSSNVVESVHQHQDHRGAATTHGSGGCN